VPSPPITDPFNVQVSAVFTATKEIPALEAFVSPSQLRNHDTSFTGPDVRSASAFGDNTFESADANVAYSPLSDAVANTFHAGVAAVATDPAANAATVSTATPVFLIPDPLSLVCTRPIVPLNPTGTLAFFVRSSRAPVPATP